MVMVSPSCWICRGQPMSVTPSSCACARPAYGAIRLQEIWGYKSKRNVAVRRQVIVVILSSLLGRLCGYAHAPHIEIVICKVEKALQSNRFPHNIGLCQHCQVAR